MADIKIDNIQPAGVELFADSESFLNELAYGEIANINGGRSGDVIIQQTISCTIQCTKALAKALASV
ncbi:hypothetical protein [Nostoc sp.]|uniref:hypothetical protein n=1 Tax=Nostoc sp. TaxID=1180 RepID=UPI002FF99CEC